MKQILLGNAFSLQMLDLSKGQQVDITPVQPQDVPVDAMSVVGHQDMAVLVGKKLGREVAYNRVSSRLEKGDILYVAQYVGGRLPEGVTELPAGAEIKFLRVSIL